MSSASSSRLRSLVIRWARCQPRTLDRGNQSLSPLQSEQGLTLIECLVAIIVITLTVVAITPPIMLATATRVQSRRGEQATQIAQGEIDRVRLLVERSDKLLNYTKDDLPSNAGTTINNVPAATTDPASGPLSSPSNTCAATYPIAIPPPPAVPPAQPAATALVRVDIDGDCKPDYMMQVFRAEDQTSPGATAATPPFAFKVGVRVYKYFPDETLPVLDTERASMISTGGGSRDNSLGGGKRKPLAVLYSTIARSGSSSTLCQVRQQIKASDSCGTPSPSPSP